MDRLNAVAIAKIDELFHACVDSRPGDEAPAACRTAIVSLYWTIMAISALGDAAIALLFGRVILGDWPVWGAIALGCVAALALIAVTGRLRAHIDALGSDPQRLGGGE